MTHILTECNAPGQKEIWNLAKELWLTKYNLSVITGCSLAKFPNGKGQHKLGAEHFYCILMTESAHLIWRIRCECIIQWSDKEHCSRNKEISIQTVLTHGVALYRMNYL